MMSSIHQKKTDSTDKIAVFYSDDAAGGKGLSTAYFDEYVFKTAPLASNDSFINRLEQK